MGKEKLNKHDFQDLIEKYLDGKTTQEELKLLVNYYESYQQDHTWVKAIGGEEAVKNRMLINILEELQDEGGNNLKVIPFYRKSIVKYAVAASLMVLVSIPFFFKNSDGNVTDIDVVNTIKPNIKIGTDKAILTLGDGSHVALGKGTTFSRQNAKSNGEKIVYENKDLKTEDIEYNYLTIPRGGQFSIRLSDGTQVWLNSESKLKYPVKFIQGQPRQVELVYGEAYFDVSPSSEHHGSKFRVLSDAQVVEVIGTEFNIKTYKDESIISTTLVEGKVVVNIDGNEKNLVPGQQLYLDKTTKTLLIKTVDVYNETSWKEGVFTFEDKTLKEMMKVLSRWYNVEIIIENKAIENKGFVGVLRKNQKIEEILINIKNFKIIKDYEILDGKIILH